MSDILPLFCLKVENNYILFKFVPTVENQSSVHDATRDLCCTTEGEFTKPVDVFKVTAVKSDPVSCGLCVAELESWFSVSGHFFRERSGVSGRGSVGQRSALLRSLRQL